MRSLDTGARVVTVLNLLAGQFLRDPPERRPILLRRQQRLNVRCCFSNGNRARDTRYLRTSSPCGRETSVRDQLRGRRGGEREKAILGRIDIRRLRKRCRDAEARSRSIDRSILLRFFRVCPVFRYPRQDGHPQYGQYLEHAVLSDEQPRRCIGALAAAAEKALFEQRGEYACATVDGKPDIASFPREKWALWSSSDPARPHRVAESGYSLRVLLDLQISRPIRDRCFPASFNSKSISPKIATRQRFFKL